MKINLAINLGFAVNRLTPPEQWVPYVRKCLGLNRVQLTADMFMPYLLDPLALKIARRTREIADAHGVMIDSTFTGAFTRLNHFSHPDPEVRQYWLRWFKAFADISVALGATSLGSHFGIQTMPDCLNSETREEMLQTALGCWRELAQYAREAGLSFLTWEPMSIPREYGETIRETERIQARLADFPLPMLLCFDVDHGDGNSPNKDDTDPYVWLERFGAITPLIHLKQSQLDKGGHWPFTAEHNAKGKIFPEEVIQALKRGQAREVCFILEVSFRERSAAERRMTEDLRQSIEFWKPYCQP